MFEVIVYTCFGFETMIEGTFEDFDDAVQFGRELNAGFKGYDHLECGVAIAQNGDWICEMM